jgi:hypothetical protein
MPVIDLVAKKKWWKRLAVWNTVVVLPAEVSVENLS